MRSARKGAIRLALDLPIPVMSSTARVEPGVVGIRKPVLLLPAGITDRLTPDQLDAVLAHEMCHVRRRDNLTAAIHMVVEAVISRTVGRNRPIDELLSLFGGRAKLAMAHMVESGELTLDDIKEAGKTVRKHSRKGKPQ